GGVLPVLLRVLPRVEVDPSVVVLDLDLLRDDPSAGALDRLRVLRAVEEDPQPEVARFVLEPALLAEARDVGQPADVALLDRVVALERLLQAALDRPGVDDRALLDLELGDAALDAQRLRTFVDDAALELAPVLQLDPVGGLVRG